MRPQVKKALLLLALLTALMTSLAGILWAKSTCVYTGSGVGLCALQHGKCVLVFGSTDSCVKVK